MDRDELLQENKELTSKLQELREQRWTDAETKIARLTKALQDYELSTAAFQQTLHGIHTDVATVKKAVLGDEADGRPGLCTRVHDLESAARRRAWMLRAVLTAALSAVAGEIVLLWHMFLNNGGKP